MQTARWTHSHEDALAPEIERPAAPAQPQHLRLVIVQKRPGVWLVRGLEHDIVVEGRSIGVAVRAAIGFVQAHTAFDARHDHEPLSAFAPAPPSYWRAYVAGTPVSLIQLGIATPAGWEIHAAVAHRRP